MADLLPFRRRKKTWTRPEDYAPRDWGRVIPAHQWRGEAPRLSRLKRFWRGARWWLGLVVLALLWVLWRDAVAWRAPAFLEGTPVKVSGRFATCAAGRGPRCVIDGDTLALGGKSIRLVGIDAPELRGACPAETAMAQRASGALLLWVNAGPFELVPRLDRPADKYGRALMTARRARGGREETAAGALLAAGLARPYSGEARSPWC
jgi:hypothetical protein